MNLLDPSAINESLALLDTLPRPPRVMVTITMQVPVDDLDLSKCILQEVNEYTEAWGLPCTITGYDFEPVNVTFAGFPAEIADQDLNTVFNYLKQERGL